ncbi:hypothetical protein FBZ89_109221 [Nitrospirillum amazonense]|uniref:Uncharacterized protein n=1 Tax=Nitrospirillum amazonense TaxID=28077 RepID=A0A560FB87_9PROT|nr:hypothetical protein [Nitrospirillum amazonense]TWB18835.1 hypothetical protein FBZ89_109221 [Nitrospirillum amazonense]
MGKLTKRAHHFYVSIAKFVFYHAQHGIVSVRDPIGLAAAERYALSPLIMYGLTVAGLPIRWLTFSPIDKPLPFSHVLQMAWNRAEGLRGPPDAICVNRHIAQAAPSLAPTLARIGVRLEIADNKDKSLSASLRSAQDAARWLLRRPTPPGSSIDDAVSHLCNAAQADHDSDNRLNFQTSGSRNLARLIEQWRSLPVRSPDEIAFEGANWTTGPWLSSWEFPLPPHQPRYFHQGSFDGNTWLLLGKAPINDGDEEDEAPVEYGYDNASEIAKNLVACWPNQPKEIASAAGTTLRQLQWFISGRSPLDPSIRYNLEDILGIEYDEQTCRYIPAGPYVLIAQKTKALEYIYTEISDGGNASPYELIPVQGAADPSWRYILVNAYDKPPSIIMVPRGEAIGEVLPKLILNFEGTRNVSLPFYRDVVATCARACRTPEANAQEMDAFASRYEEQWANCMWLPE